jgi:hypothetical protein
MGERHRNPPLRTVIICLPCAWPSDAALSASAHDQFAVAASTSDAPWPMALAVSRPACRWAAWALATVHLSPSAKGLTAQRARRPVNA